MGVLVAKLCYTPGSRRGEYGEDGSVPVLSSP